MTADPPAAPAPGRLVEPERAADGRVQSVGGGEVAALDVTAAHARAVLGDRADVAVHESHTGVRGGILQGLRQHRAADPHALAGAEIRVHPPGVVQIGNAAKRPAVQRDAERLELGDGVRHQTFPAGLVDGPAAAVDDDGVQSGPGGVDGGGQPRGPGSGDDEIGHDNRANAAFSVLIRVARSAALSTVNTSAVIQAVCTSGSAMPSATTAT